MSGHYNLKGEPARIRLGTTKESSSPFSLDQGDPFMQGQLQPTGLSFSG